MHMHAQELMRLVIVLRDSHVSDSFPNPPLSFAMDGRAGSMAGVFVPDIATALSRPLLPRRMAGNPCFHIPSCRTCCEASRGLCLECDAHPHAEEGSISAALVETGNTQSRKIPALGVSRAHTGFDIVTQTGPCDSLPQRT